MSRTKLLLAVVAGALSAFLGAIPAHAHNSLTGSDPENGARVAAVPASITLTFLARLDPTATDVTVTGPGGDVANGPPGVRGRTVTLGVRDAGGGTYTVAYRVSSVDGHPVKGTVTFRVTAPADAAAPVPSTESAAPPVSGPPSAVADVHSADAPTRWPWLAGGAVLLLAAAGAGIRLIRRRSTS
jgi:hypothetical protein